MESYVRLWYLAELLLEREMFPAKIVEKIKTHVMFNKPPPPQNRAGYEIMGDSVVKPASPQTISHGA